MIASDHLKIFALILFLFLLSACMTQEDGVEPEGISEPSTKFQSNGSSPPITPTPFLPEATMSPVVNDDVAIRAALIGRLGASEDELGITLAENTGLHAKGEVREEYFLAYKEESGWMIVYIGLENPPCRTITESQFPADMVPECMDEENNLVVRVPETEAAIRIALAERIGIGTEEMEITITDFTGEHLLGRVNNGYFFAVKGNDGWLVVYDGPIPPPCSDIEAYQFPTDMVPQCLDNNEKIVTR